MPQSNIVPNHKQFWDELTAAKLNSTIFTVSVIEPVVKGVPDPFDGLISVSGVRVQVTEPFTTSFPRLAFIPLSQMDTYLPRRIRPDQKKEIIAAGTRLQVLVLDATQEKQRITLSESAARHQAYIEFWRRTKVNDILLARVASGLNELNKFYLTIGGVDFQGRVSISLDDLTDDEAFLFKVMDAQQDFIDENSALPIGTEFEVVVTAISADKHTIALSAKRVHMSKMANRKARGTVVEVVDSSDSNFGILSAPKPGDRIVAIGAEGIGQYHVLVPALRCGNFRLAKQGDQVELRLSTDESGGERWHIPFKSA